MCPTTTLDAPCAADTTRQRVRPSLLRRVDVLLLGAVILVVCLVSLPRLEAYVRNSNEADARLALKLLAEACFDPSQPSPGDLATVTGTSRRLRHRLRDARLLEGRPTLLYHGYLFEFASGPAGESWIVAWPRRAGSTGAGIYAWRPGAGLMGAPNRERRWSGVDGGPPAAAGVGWEVLAP